MTNAEIDNIQREARAAGYREGLERAAQIGEEMAKHIGKHFHELHTQQEIMRVAERIRAEASPTEHADGSR